MTQDITIFIDPNCPECRHLKQYLHNRRIVFKQIDVTSNVEGQRYLDRLDAEAIPVVRVGDDHIIGFDKTALEALLPGTEKAIANSR